MLVSTRGRQQRPPHHQKVAERRKLKHINTASPFEPHELQTGVLQFNTNGAGSVKRSPPETLVTPSSMPAGNSNPSRKGNRSIYLAKSPQPTKPQPPRRKFLQSKDPFATMMSASFSDTTTSFPMGNKGPPAYHRPSKSNVGESKRDTFDTSPYALGTQSISEQFPRNGTMTAMKDSLSSHSVHEFDRKTNRGSHPLEYSKHTMRHPLTLRPTKHIAPKGQSGSLLNNNYTVRKKGSSRNPARSTVDRSRNYGRTTTDFHQRSSDMSNFEEDKTYAKQKPGEDQRPNPVQRPSTQMLAFTSDINVSGRPHSTRKHLPSSAHRSQPFASFRKALPSSPKDRAELVPTVFQSSTPIRNTSSSQHMTHLDQVEEERKARAMFDVGAATMRGFSNGVPKTNQDRFIAYFDISTKSLITAVFDGHGAKGHFVSSYLAGNMVGYLLQHSKWAENASLCEAMTDTLLHLEEGISLDKNIDATFSGSTAVVAVVRNRKLYIINAGDSRLVTACQNNDGSCTVYHSTRDHKPDLPAERKRIIATGGRVIATANKMTPHILGPARVWLKDTMIPGLAMSRSIGDFVAKSAGVTSSPEHMTVNGLHKNSWIILASDGLWDVMNNSEALNIASMTGKGQTAADNLLRISRKRWMDRAGASDDITILVVKVND